jgi:hypothetical protein
MLYVFPYARGLNFNICHTILMLAILNVISRMIFALVKVIFNFSILFIYFFSLNTFDEDIFTTIFLQVLFLLSLCTFLYKKKNHSSLSRTMPIYSLPLSHQSRVRSYYNQENVSNESGRNNNKT